MDEDPDRPAALRGAGAAAAPARLLPSLREAIRVRHYALRTEQADGGWVRRFAHLHGLRHPRELGGTEVEAFLSHLAAERGVSSSTQSHAKAALLYLYKQVLRLQLPWLDEVVSAKAWRRPPVLLTSREVSERLPWHEAARRWHCAVRACGGAPCVAA